MYTDSIKIFCGSFFLKLLDPKQGFKEAALNRKQIKYREMILLLSKYCREHSRKTSHSYIGIHHPMT
jgi:hypothetical protein